MTLSSPLLWIGLFLLASWVWFGLRLIWFSRLAPRGQQLEWFNAQMMGVLIWTVLSLFAGGGVTSVMEGLGWALVPGLSWFWAWLLHSALLLTLLLWLGKLGLRVIHLGPKRAPGESARDYEQRSREWLVEHRAQMDARVHQWTEDGGEEGEGDEGAPLSPAEGLRQLKALRDEGLINEAEFEQRRRVIVKSL